MEIISAEAHPYSTLCSPAKERREAKIALVLCMSHFPRQVVAIARIVDEQADRS
jgi:hypothetical protein